MALTEYNVLRRHVGDQTYEVGDTRKANAVEVSHLIGKTLEEKPAPKAKSKDKG